MRRRFLLIHNPIAGLRGRTLPWRVARRLESLGCEVVIMRQYGLPTLKAARGMLDHADLDTFDAVIAAGGDGTVRALLEPLEHRRVPLGIIPMGTGNVLAHEIGMPRKVREIADVLYAGPEAILEPATVNGAPFLLMAGAGFDGRIIAALDLETKRSWGKAAYVWPTLKALAQEEPELAVTVDGVRHAARWAVVSRAQHYAGGFTLVPGASLFDTDLHVVLFGARTLAGRVAEGAYLAAGRVGSCGSATVLRGRHVRIETTDQVADPVPVEVDGDPFGALPVEIDGRGHGRVRLIVPPAFAAANPKALESGGEPGAEVALA